MKSKNLSFLQYIFVGSFILFKFCDCLHKSEEYGPTNGVEGEQRLMKKLKSSIPTMWPPVDMVNRTVFIYVDLFKIQEVDEKNGMWVGKFFIYVYYYSPSAQWNKSEYNNGTVESFLLPKGTLWMPDIIVHEASERKYDAFNRQVVFEHGMILAMTTLTTCQMSCLFDVSQFPFDSQQCVVTLTTHVSRPSDYQLGLEDRFFPPNSFGKSHLPLKFFTASDQWRLKTPVQIQLDELPPTQNETRGRPMIRVTIDLQRRPLFYKLVFVYPSVILYLLSSVTFFIPPDSGEKVSFAVTILLTEVVSCGTLVDVLPASSHHVPFLIFFMAAVTLHLTCTCVMAVSDILIYHINADKLK
ncbi:neuronal acetylcholine receptor subunit alpha-7-like [Symsagittifera roscoffensis]|uniref:neuronal acetylcholine receptor subunit alpha-7-like n=1 Tax=Symsagittifera roscoffensis TaxID=84072 RepID=UPI00307B69B6